MASGMLGYVQHRQVMIRRSCAVFNKSTGENEANRSIARLSRHTGLLPANSLQPEIR